MPAGCLEARDLVSFVSNINSAVDGDVVVVKEDDEVAQFMHASEADCLLAHTFHKAAVASHDICVVVDDLFAKPCPQNFFGDGKAYGIGDTLAQWASCRLNAGGMAILRMACSDGTPIGGNL